MQGLKKGQLFLAGLVDLAKAQPQRAVKADLSQQHAVIASLAGKAVLMTYEHDDSASLLDRQLPTIR
ncbi:hypothetical protein HNP46_006065 [Pseudomonas nitritireducens]|uniref:Uncharacterized protein n=1 Tax=Pseudomonas nitroreducens TaxID=46680 RepID=A0A7W7P4R3_PSENT|nr:hypothetical protein [Pseudomonas nitritireducens]MBB4867154.1 hypothetical protein [Pseudomonas nitritireducens]